MTDPKSPLDGFFDAARANPPAPSTDLMARVRADAASQMAQNRRKPTKASSFGQRILALWPVWSGAVPAALTGLWLGMNPPDMVPDPLLWLGLSSDQMTEVSTGYEGWGYDWDEEGQL